MRPFHVPAAIDKGSIPVPPKVWRWVIQTSIIFLVIATGIQFGIESTVENVVCACIALVAPLLLSAIMVKRGGFKSHPLTVVSIFLFFLSNLILPLIIKTMDLEPITYKLQVPMMTFGLNALVAATLVFVYLLYAGNKQIGRIRHFISTKIYAPLAVFEPPTDFQLWFMGFFGAMATVYVLMTGTLYEKVHTKDVTLAHFVWTWAGFAYAPFLILARYLFERVNSNTKARPYVIIQFLIIGGLGVGMNGRAPMVMPLVNIGVWIIIGIMTGLSRVRMGGLRNFVLFTVLIIGFAPIATDFATAMVVARAAREKVGAMEVASRAIDAMGQKSQLEQERSKEESVKGNDVYVHNEFLTRFIDVKFLDQSLYWTLDMNNIEKKQFNDLAIERAWEIFPTPIAKAVGIDIDKDKRGNQKSFADFLFDARYSTNDLVAHRTGSFIAFGLVFHDIAFFPIFGLFCLILFMLFDSFVIKVRGTGDDGKPLEYVRVAPIALCNIYLICGMFLALNAHESEIFYVQWIFRDLPTMVIEYFILFWMAKAVANVTTMGGRRKKNTAQTQIRFLRPWANRQQSS